MARASVKERARIEKGVRGLARRSRMAFALACPERVLPIPTWHFGPKGERHLRKIVDLCWRFVAGTKVARRDLAAAEKRCDDLLDELDDDDEEGSPAFHAVTSLACAVATTLQEDADAQLAIAAAEHASEAAMGDDDRDWEAHAREESRWQLRALEVARAAPRPTRKAFEDLAGDPEWLQRFRRRNGLPDAGATPSPSRPETPLDGLYLEQDGSRYDLLRFYPDGLVLFGTVDSASPREKVIATVRTWLERESANMETGVYRCKDGKVEIDYANTQKSFSIRGKVDARGHLVLVWRELKSGTKSATDHAPALPAARATTASRPDRKQRAQTKRQGPRKTRGRTAR